MCTHILIGFIQLLTKKKDDLFRKDVIGKQTYWDVTNKGKSDILIRRT
jgi:hypothetical protein